ncbi:MAG: GWxTD domain-containing protein [Bacteroidetes bacterium]|nr:MAG: GWxTD domain-containing protein [Bacteroidota bacterium]
MKKIILLWSLSLVFLNAVRALDVSVSCAAFASPTQNYVEVSLHVVGQTVEFVPVDTVLKQASVAFLILIKKGERVVRVDKFILNSPTSTYPLNFIDLKRYGLENGKYQIEVTATDVNKPENTAQSETEVRLFFSKEKLQQSDIQLLASFRKAAPGEKSPFIKNGYYLESLPFGFYGKNAGSLEFYHEIYNSDKAIGEDFMVTYKVEKAQNGESSNPILVGHKRRKPAPVDVLLIQFDISQVPSGNYRLVVEVRDKTRALLSKKSVFFQRSNPYLNLDPEAVAQAGLEGEFVNELDTAELVYALRAIAPLAEQDAELINLLVKESKPEAMRLYLFSFWAKENPTRPREAYESFMAVARHADEFFKSGFGYGFETDRGYTYIKYGAPSEIIRVEDDPAAPPYEIWTYNDFPVTRQSNVKFLFYNPSLSTNNFVLLHSTARGEVNNPRWEIQLYGQSPNEIEGSDYFGGTRMMDNMGRRARRLMEE